jgi:AcrR family transcriptional regulator
MRKNQNATLRKPEILESYYQVLIEQGLEGASISKIAKHMGIHPSLIIHYFKNKENMKLELIDLLIEKYKSPDMIIFEHIEDDKKRFYTLIDILFSFDWSRTVDPGIHFGFYYLSFRNKEIQKRFKRMFVWLRDYIQEQLVYFNSKDIININDEKQAADLIVTLMEGMEFHSHFLSDNHSFDTFSQVAKKNILHMLQNNEI